MPIFALFLCFHATQTCQMQGAPRMTFAVAKAMIEGAELKKYEGCGMIAS